MFVIIAWMAYLRVCFDGSPSLQVRLAYFNRYFSPIFISLDWSGF